MTIVYGPKFSVCIVMVNFSFHVPFMSKNLFDRKVLNSVVFSGQRAQADHRRNFFYHHLLMRACIMQTYDKPQPPILNNINQPQKRKRSPRAAIACESCRESKSKVGDHAVNQLDVEY